MMGKKMKPTPAQCNVFSIFPKQDKTYLTPRSERSASPHEEQHLMVAEEDSVRSVANK